MDILGLPEAQPLPGCACFWLVSTTSSKLVSWWLLAVMLQQRYFDENRPCVYLVSKACSTSDCKSWVFNSCGFLDASHASPSKNDSKAQGCRSTDAEQLTSAPKLSYHEQNKLRNGNGICSRFQHSATRPLATLQQPRNRSPSTGKIIKPMHRSRPILRGSFLPTNTQENTLT